MDTNDNIIATLLNQLSAVSDEQAEYLDSQDVRLALLNAPEVLKTLKVFSSRLMRVIYTLFGCALLENEKNPPQIAGDTEEKGIIEITQEDLKKMPKTINKGKIFVEGFPVGWRKRQTGENSYSYQVRFNRDGIEITFSEKKKEDLKPRFLKELKIKLAERNQQTSLGVPADYDGFTMYVFENFRKPKVAATTYKLDFQKYQTYIKPFLGKLNVKDIVPGHCKRVIDNLLDKGHERLAQSTYSLMNVTFKSAVAHQLIGRNPMDILLPVSHECEHGVSLTYKEEEILMLAVKGTPYEVMFALALYTGMRPNEYATAWRDNDFIHCVNSKRKTKKVEYKKIPISPMLRPYLEGVTEFHFTTLKRMREKMKEILPNHKLYDLRTTFYTRCQECGVAEVARKEFVGHSLGALGNTYTDLSDEFLLKEGENLKY